MERLNQRSLEFLKRQTETSITFDRMQCSHERSTLNFIEHVFYYSESRVVFRLRLRCNVRHLKSKSYLKHPEPLANTETTSDLKSHLKLFTLVPTFLQVDAYRTVHPDPI